MNPRTIRIALATLLSLVLCAAIAAPRLVGRCDGALQFHNSESEFTGNCEWIEPL